MVAAAPVDSEVEVKAEPAEFKAGTELVFKVKVALPADKILTMFHVYAYLPEIPSGMDKLSAVELHPNSDPKWSAVWFTVKPFWLPQADWSKQEHVFKLKTEDWPVGDYRLLFKVLLRDKVRPEVKTDRYVVVPVMVTVVPAA